MKKPLVLLGTSVTALALAGAVGVGVAAADPATAAPPTSSPSASPTSGAAAGSSQATTKKHRDPMRRALHGEVTLAGKNHRVVDFQRGTVSAVSASSVTVRSADGFVGTYVVGPKTHVRVDKKQAAIGDVATGDHVRVVAAKDGQTLTATRVVDRKQ